MAQKLSYAERARKAQNSSLPTSSSSAPTTNTTLDGLESSSTPAHTESAKPMPPQPTKPIANVWNLRMEKMAAARAGQKSAVNQPSDLGSTPSPTTGTSRSDNRPPDGRPQNPSPVPIIEGGDPFVVKMPEHLQNTQHPTVISTTPPEHKSNTKGQHSDQDSWPEIGKAISVSASSSSKSTSSNVTEDGSRNTHGNGSSSSNSPRKTEKFKWVSIPKQELQEAADAAAASASNHRPHVRKSPRQSPTNNATVSSSTSTNSAISMSSLNASQSQSRIPSTHTSASQSRSESLQSSPNISRGVGKKLLPDSNAQELTSALASNIEGNALRNSYNEQDRPIAVPLVQIKLEADDGHDNGQGEGSKKPTGNMSRENNNPSLQIQNFPSMPSYLPPTGSGYNIPAAQFPSGPLSVHRLSPSQATPHVYPAHHHPELTGAASNSSAGSRNHSGSSSPLIFQPQHLSASGSGHYTPPYPQVTQIHANPYSHSQYPSYNFNANLSSYDYLASPHSQYLHYSAQPLPPSTTVHPYGGAAVNDGMVPGLVNGAPQIPPPPATNNAPPPPTREKMVFGSIDVTPSESETAKHTSTKEKEDEREREKKKLFAIGVDNAADVPARLRTAQKKSVGNGKISGGSAAEKEKEARKEIKKDEKDGKKTKDDDRRGSAATAQTSTTAPTETKWRFGTTSTSPPPPPLSQSPTNGTPTNLLTPQDAQTDLLPLPSTGDPPSPLSLDPNNAHPTMPHLESSHSESSIPPVHPQHHSNYPHTYDHTPSSSLPSNAIPLQVSASTFSNSSDPDLEVKDFGYGFGAASGLGYTPMLAKEKLKEWEAERERQRVAAAAAAVEAAGWQDGTSSEDAARVVKETDPSANGQFSQREQMSSRDHYPGRGGRRASFTNGRGFSGGDRGHRRGRGTNGFPRGFRGFSNPAHHSHPRGITVATPISTANSRGSGGPSSPYTDTPPGHFQPLPIDSSNSGSLVAPSPLTTAGYYPHPHLSLAPGRPYLPPGYEAYLPSPTLPSVSHATILGHQMHPSQAPGQPHNPGKVHLTPPVPVPMTTILFPLDPTRYYLLGQLEYYLSPQNMAQDLYLRQQMDARGWIPISLIASFNRVRNLTPDVQLVRDVLTLSSLVQVRGNMVRMGGWEQFVLPDAALSTVEEQPLPYPYQNLTNYYYPSDDGSSGRDRGGTEGAGYNAGLYLHGGQVAAQAYGEVGKGVHGGGVALLNGHNHDPDEDEDDDVEIVMGQEVGMLMSDRPTSS